MKFAFAALLLTQIIYCSEKENMFPNESSINVFRDLKTNEIYWEDPKNLISIGKKEEIESCLQLIKKEMSNCLFDCLFNWNVPSVARSFFKELIFAMSQNVDIDRIGELNKTPMWHASRFDVEAAVVKLIERGAKVDAVSAHKNTALHSASSYGNASICKLLIQSGANINARTEYGYTPIMQAAASGSVETVNLLLKSGADIKSTDYQGKTALQLARIWRQTKCAVLIEAHEAKLKIN